MPKLFFITGLLLLSTAMPEQSPAAETVMATCHDQAMQASAACSHVATAQKAAIVQVRTDPKAVALKVTARPITGEDAPYLVGVFVEDKDHPGAPTMLGSFSFFPVHAGETQTFVLPKPREERAGEDVMLSVKLIPANPQRDIKDAAVEIVGASLVGE